MNGEDSLIIKIPKCDIEKLTENEAIEMMLKQKQIQDILSERTLLSTSYSWFADYEGVVKIRTTQPAKKAVKN